MKKKMSGLCKKSEEKKILLFITYENNKNNKILEVVMNEDGAGVEYIKSVVCKKKL